MINDGIIGLRAVEPTDVDLLFLWENDSDSWRYGWNRAPLSRHQLWTYANNYDSEPIRAGELRMIVVELSSGEEVGCVDLTDIDAINSRAQVGIYIKSSCRGKGYGARSLALLIDYSSAMLSLHQLWAVIGRDNGASIAIFEKVGFKSCGCLRSWIKNRTSFEDALLYQKFLV